MSAKKPALFMLISTDHGMMIVNRNDYNMYEDGRGYGVGYQLMTQSCYDPDDKKIFQELLQLRRHYYGDGVIAIDCGANIGVHTVDWADLMTGWGHVYSFEAQEKIYYALAGNIILNNCLNVTARHFAVGANEDRLAIPEPDYTVASSFGSFELRKKEQNEFIGQPIDYDAPTQVVSQISLDSLSLNRVDVLKIDVEGMETDVLQGAKTLIQQCHPILFIETIKSNVQQIQEYLVAMDYTTIKIGINVLALHRDDACSKHIQVKQEDA